jgi:hypothetical protein
MMPAVLRRVLASVTLEAVDIVLVERFATDHLIDL